MLKLLWMAIICVTFAGCVATTKIIIKHNLPKEHINYEIQQGWTKTY